jgi:hypothetical protein
MSVFSIVQPNIFVCIVDWAIFHSSVLTVLVREYKLSLFSLYRLLLYLYVWSKCVCKEHVSIGYFYFYFISNCSFLSIFRPPLKGDVSKCGELKIALRALELTYTLARTL